MHSGINEVQVLNLTKKYSKEEEEDYLDALDEQPNIFLPEIKVL